MPDIRIEIPEKQIADFCKKWKVKEFALFGSVLREDFHEDSDVDVLLTHLPDAGWTLFDLVAMTEELSDLLGRKVQVLPRWGVERSKNHSLKKAILESAQVIHAA